MRPTYIALLVTLLISSKLVGQFAIGAEIIPSMSKFLSDVDQPDGFSKSVNFGIKSFYESERFKYTIGIINVKQGGTYYSEKTSSKQPEGTGEILHIQEWVYSMTFPINFDVFLLKKEDTRLYTGIGLQPGLTYDHEVIVEEGTYGSIYEDPIYMGFNFGVGLNQIVVHNFQSAIRASVNYELTPDNRYNGSHRMLLFALEFGLYYSFK